MNFIHCSVSEVMKLPMSKIAFFCTLGDFAFLFLVYVGFVICLGVESRQYSHPDEIQGTIPRQSLEDMMHDLISQLPTFHAFCSSMAVELAIGPTICHGI